MKTRRIIPPPAQSMQRRLKKANYNSFASNWQTLCSPGHTPSHDVNKLLGNVGKDEDSRPRLSPVVALRLAIGTGGDFRLPGQARCFW